MNSASVLTTAFSAGMDGLSVHDAWITVSFKKKKKKGKNPKEAAESLRWKSSWVLISQLPSRPGQWELLVLLRTC